MANNITPHPKGVSVQVSKNVKVNIPAKSNYEFSKDLSTIGKIQKENAGPLAPTKAEAKANARGLKAANAPIKTRTSGLQGKSGHLGGQHMGGHGTSIGGAEGTMGAGGGMNWETK
jgi:hypothetical protein